MNGYLPCRMVTTLRSALELGDGGVFLYFVGLLLDLLAELVGLDPTEHQRVGLGTRLGVQRLVVAVPGHVEDLLAGGLQRGAGAGDTGREVDPVRTRGHHGRRLD